MPYEVKLSKAEACISEIVEEIKKNEKVLDASYKGVSNLSDSSIAVPSVTFNNELFVSL